MQCLNEHGNSNCSEGIESICAALRGSAATTAMSSKPSKRLQQGIDFVASVARHLKGAKSLHAWLTDAYKHPDQKHALKLDIESIFDALDALDRDDLADGATPALMKKKIMKFIEKNKEPIMCVTALFATFSKQVDQNQLFI